MAITLKERYITISTEPLYKRELFELKFELQLKKYHLSELLPAEFLITPEFLP